MAKIVNVKIDYQVNPIGLDNKNPTFSWSYEGDNFIQTFYRILVATSKEKLLSNKPDIWDSREVESSVSCGIIYEGKELTSRTEYFYQIETNSGKSDIYSFETGLLNESDWVADFIGAPITRVGSALLFRKDYKSNKDLKIKKARIYVCGLGCHEFYVNGHKVSKGYLNPPVTDYNKTLLYNVYAFEDYLTEGNNSLGIIVGHGWLGNRKLLVQGYVTYETGEEDCFYSCANSDWWIKGSWIIENSIYDGEVCDGNKLKELSSWCDPKQSYGWLDNWMYSMLVDRPRGKLKRNILEPIDEVERFKPISRKEVGNTLVFDFGQNFSGFASIKVKGKKNARVTIKYGEQLDDEGHVNQLNLRVALARDIYILNGDGIEEYTPRFTYHGFRYAEVIIEGEAELLNIEGVFIRTNVEQISRFECDNETINKLHKNVIYTEGSNMHGLFTDCPQRDERFGWLNDLTVRLFQNVLNYDISNFLIKVNEDIKETQDEEGRIADTAPYVTAFRPADPVCLSYLLCGLQAYKYYGNKKLLQDSFESYKSWVDYLTSQFDPKELSIYCRFADWCPPEAFNNVESPISRITPGEYISLCFYYLHSKALSNISKMLDYEVCEKLYDLQALVAKKAILQKYYDKDKIVISSNSQACMAMCLGLDLLEGEEERILAEKFNQSIIDNDYHVILGNQSYLYAFRSLAKHGYMTTAIKTLVNPTYPGWGFMIANGATTIWERWEKDMQQVMHSFNHPMFASIDAFFINDLLGINIDDDAIAANKILIKPYFSSLINNAKGSIKTINGEIRVEFSKLSGDIHMNLYLPPNTTTKVEIENLYELNGKKINANFLELSGGGHYEIKAHYMEDK